MVNIKDGCKKGDVWLKTAYKRGFEACVELIIKQEENNETRRITDAGMRKDR